MTVQTRRSEAETIQRGVGDQVAGGQLGIPNNAQFLFGTAGASATLPLAQFLDTVTVLPMGRIKGLVVVPDGTALPTKGAGSQATIAIYSSLVTQGQASGGASQLPHNGNLSDASVVGTAVNLGINAATLVVASSPYFFTPTDIAQLQWEEGWIGVEINWGGAITSGKCWILLITAPD